MKFKMKERRKSTISTICAMVACCIAIAGAIGSTAQQATAPAPSAPVKLQPYTAPDNSASAGVPAGWTVTKGASGVIQMSGPQGETISLGNGVFVKNGPYSPGQKPMGPISLSIPYQASLAQKYAVVWKEASAQAGDPNQTVSLISNTPIPLGKIAECAVFLGSQSNKTGSYKFETRFCSLPMDTNGIYKLFWIGANIPDALAAQERATAEAVLNSYRPSPASLRLILAPATPPMAPPSGSGGGMSSTMYGERMADETANCMDEGVIREEPEWRLPPYCR
jgi:hypothetical protein